MRMRSSFIVVMIAAAAGTASADATGMTPGAFASQFGMPTAGGMMSWGVGVFNSYMEFVHAHQALSTFDETCIDVSSMGAPDVPANCADDVSGEPGTGARGRGQSGAPGAAGTPGTGEGPQSPGAPGAGPGGTGGGGSPIDAPPDAFLRPQLRGTRIAASSLSTSIFTAAGGAGGCGECYTHAQNQLNGMRLNLERLRCTYQAYARYVKASIAFGDSASGIHAVTGLAWQTERAGIQQEFDKLKQAYDQKYAAMMPNLRAALDSLSQCEAQYFHEPDWYSRFGFIYYTFMADRYKRSD